MSQDQDSDLMEADLIGPANVVPFTTCLESIHKTFDAFLSMELSIVRNLPVLFFVRTVYAAVVLVKIYGIVHAKESRFGAIYASELKAEYYVNAAVDHLAKAAGEAGQAPVPQAFRFNFEKLRAWHERRRHKIMIKGNLHQVLPPQRTPSSADQNSITHHSEPCLAGSQGSTQLGRSFPETPFTSQRPTDTFLSNPEQFDLDNFNFTFEELNAMDSLVENAAWTSFLV